MPLRKVEPRSLRLRLLLAALVPLVALAIAGVTFGYLSARALLGESSDRALASIAIGLAARLETDRDGDLPAHLRATMRAVGRLVESDDLVYLVLDGKGHLIAGDARLSALIRHGAPRNPALHDAHFLGHAVRTVTYAYAGPDGRATIVVAEAMGKRLAEARRILLPTTATNLVMALAMVVSSVLAVGFALGPLDALGKRVEGHEVRELRPMRLRGLPSETRPLVRAINRLMARLRRTTEARQRFIDNTAHQLRTPLAGLQTQVALLASEPLPAPALERVRNLQGDVKRLAHLTHQMLALARAGQVSAATPPAQSVSLPDLLQEAASACIDAAVAKGVDLGFDASPATVTGWPWMLRELLVNLVDNAIQHTPNGSVVTARCGVQSGRAFLDVEDDGPGIPGPDRERVFDRHVRLASDGGQGTGLGLAIVREIAGHHHAQVMLGEGAQGRGLRVRVVFGA